MGIAVRNLPNAEQAPRRQLDKDTQPGKGFQKVSWGPFFLIVQE